jgi:seryl-tRNA synthetase
MTRGESIARQIAADTRDALQERNPLQKAYDSYHEMERERDAAQQEVTELITSNNALVAEINMLRETLDRSEADRVKFQSISSTLLGRLLAINDCIAGAVKASIDSGIEQDHDDLEQAGADAQEIIQRVEPPQAPKSPAELKGLPMPPLATGEATGTVPAVDWSLLPRGQRLQPS